jgi:hypothetical protein
MTATAIFVGGIMVRLVSRLKNRPIVGPAVLLEPITMQAR